MSREADAACSGKLGLKGGRGYGKCRGHRKQSERRTSTSAGDVRLDHRDFIPGGCTPLLQACNVGVQRIFKLGIKQSAHANIVAETLEQLQAGKSPSQVQLDKKTKVVCNRSVRWLLNGYHSVNKTEVVQKVSTRMHLIWSMNLPYLKCCAAARMTRLSVSHSIQHL